MKLTNTIVTFTVTVPVIEIHSDTTTTDAARWMIREEAKHQIKINSDEMVIVDCPSYPALCN